MTVRPANGLTDEMIERAVTCFSKLDGAYAVTEKLGVERHLHAALFFAEAVRKTQVVERLKRVQGEMTDAELRVLQSGVKIMYNGDWMEKYLTKGDDTVVVWDTKPAEVEKYFPSEDETAKMKQRIGMSQTEVVAEYDKRNDVVTIGRVWDFLRDMWFREQMIRTPENEAKQLSAVKNLFAYLSLRAK